MTIRDLVETMTEPMAYIYEVYEDDDVQESTSYAGIIESEYFDARFDHFEVYKETNQFVMVFIIYN